MTETTLFGAPAPTRCAHLNATYELETHGTYVKYTIDRCRCADCRQANRMYERERIRRKESGEFDKEWVPAEPVRRRLLSLMKGNGPNHKEALGPKSMAKASGVPHGVISALIYGRYDRRPRKKDGTIDKRRKPKKSRRLKRENAERLLALTKQNAMPGGSSVPGGETRSLIGCMVGFGIPKARISDAVSRKGRSANRGLQVARTPSGNVSRRTQKAIWSMHWRIWIISPAFRWRCMCEAPQKIKNIRDSAPQDVTLRSWTEGWIYDTERGATVEAARLSGPQQQPVVTEHPDGTWRWYTDRSYVPQGETVIRWRDEAGDWKPHRNTRLRQRRRAAMQPECAPA